MRISLREIVTHREKQQDIIRWVLEGKTFVYPTDTVYGLGCDATQVKAVHRIRDMKKTDHPLSVIVPSKKWVQEHLLVTGASLLNKLPGPTTIILRKRKPFLDHISGPTLGVRIPDHPLTAIVQKSGRPFVTTSCNRSGENTISSVSALPKVIEEHVDVIIDGGELQGRPSTVIDTSGETVKIIRK